MNYRVYNFKVEASGTRMLKLGYSGGDFFCGLIFCRCNRGGDYSVYSINGYGTGPSRININSLCSGNNNSITIEVADSNEYKIVVTNSSTLASGNVVVIMPSGVISSIE